MDTIYQLFFDHKLEGIYTPVEHHHQYHRVLCCQSEHNPQADSTLGPYQGRVSDLLLSHPHYNKLKQEPLSINII